MSVAVLADLVGRYAAVAEAAYRPISSAAP